MTDIVERLREQPKMSIFANIGDMVGRLNHEREEAADEIERLRQRCTYFYEALHDIALGAHGDDGIEFARKAIGFVKLEFDADKIAAANDLINRAALGEEKE